MTQLNRRAAMAAVLCAEQTGLVIPQLLDHARLNIRSGLLKFRCGFRLVDHAGDLA